MMKVKIHIRSAMRPDGNPITGQDTKILAVTEDGAEYLLPAEFIDIYCAGRNEQIRARLTLPIDDLILDGVLEKIMLHGQGTTEPYDALDILLRLANDRADANDRAESE